MTNEYGISTLDGGYGNDNILALGNTLITGGRGDDTFVFLYVEHATSSAPNIITDFEQGKDVIDLSALTTLSLSAPVPLPARGVLRCVTVKLQPTRLLKSMQMVMPP